MNLSLTRHRFFLITLALFTSQWVTAPAFAELVFDSHGRFTISQSETGADLSHPDFAGTQIEMLESGLMQRRTLENMRAMHANLQEADVEIHAKQEKDGTFLVIASGPNAKYTQVYLEALLEEFVRWRNEIRAHIFLQLLNGFIEDVLLMERRVKQLDAAVSAAEATGEKERLVVLQGQLNRARSAYAVLKKKIEDLDNKANPAPDTSITEHATAAEGVQ